MRAYSLSTSSNFLRRFTPERAVRIRLTRVAEAAGAASSELFHWTRSFLERQRESILLYYILYILGCLFLHFCRQRQIDAIVIFRYLVILSVLETPCIPLKTKQWCCLCISPRIQ